MFPKWARLEAGSHVRACSPALRLALYALPALPHVSAGTEKQHMGHTVSQSSRAERAACSLSRGWHSLDLSLRLRTRVCLLVTSGHLGAGTFLTLLTPQKLGQKGSWPAVARMTLQGCATSRGGHANAVCRGSGEGTSVCHLRGVNRPGQPPCRPAVPLLTALF